MRKRIIKVFTLVLTLALVLGSVAMPSEDVSAKAKVKLNKTSATVKIGASVNLKLKNATGEVTWKVTGKTSNGKKVASVKNGKVTGLREGVATVKATYNKKTYLIDITTINVITY